MNAKYHTRFWLVSVFTALGIILPIFSKSADAAAILKVDFGGTAVQSGFEKAFTTMSDSSGPQTASFTVPGTVVASGAIEVKIGGNLDFTAGSLNVRTRSAPVDSGEFTNSNLLKDRVVNISGGAQGGLFLQLSGLDPNTSYSIQVWGYDNAKPGNFSLLDRTGGNNSLLGNYSITTGALPQNNDDFSVIGIVTSDMAGNIIVQSQSNIDGVGIMNGFVLSAVPEPATAATLLGGMGVLVMGARFRRAR